MDELMVVAGIIAAIAAGKLGIMASKGVAALTVLMVEWKTPRESRELGPWARRRWSYSLSSTHKSQQGQRT